MSCASRLGRRLLTAATAVLITSTALTAQEGAARKLTPAERDFVHSTALESNYELAAARVALTTTRSDVVRGYASTILTEHTGILARLTAVVRALDAEVSLPTGLSIAGEERLKLLRAATDGFDLTYRGQMISSHTEAQAAFQAFLESASFHPRLRAVVAGALPLLDAHLAAAKELPRRI